VICRPFVGPLYCTIKNARRVTLIIYIIGVFYAVPLMFEYELHEEKALSEFFLVDANNNNNNNDIYRLKLSDFGRNSVFRWTYVLINALAVYIIPLIIIAILNRKLLISIRLLEQRSAEYNAPLPTKQGKINSKISCSTFEQISLEINLHFPSSISQMRFSNVLKYSFL
jgi:hypothetical protein